MLTIEEIKKELDAGNTVELECVDSIGFLGAHHRNQSILKVGRLVVSSVDDTGVCLKDCFPGISPEELKYFRIKRPTPTFKELISVAVQAVEDRALFKVSIGHNKRKGRYLNYAVSGSSPSESFYESDDDYQACIDLIKSLYTETFVIEGDSDIERLRDGAKITLTNNEKGVFNIISGLRSITNTGTGAEIMGLNTFWLKGATVTQKRGEV